MRHIEYYNLDSYEDSVNKIKEYVDKYYKDLSLYNSMTFGEFYTFVCNIPYFEDQEIELIKRPQYIIKDNLADCKKKSLLVASWCRLIGLNCRLVVCSHSPNKVPHHIYTEVEERLGKEWISCDATYKHNKLGYVNKETFRKVFEI